jgi:hypothetical protein
LKENVANFTAGANPSTERAVNPRVERLALVGYQLADAKGPDSLPASLRLSNANAFGAHVLQVGQPELVFLPSLVE